MSLRSTLALWVVSLIVACGILLTMTVLEVHLNGAPGMIKWQQLQLDIIVELCSEAAGIFVDIVLLIAILKESRAVVGTWLALAPFRIVLDLGGAILALATTPKGMILRNIVSGLRIIFGVMLLYTLYVGYYYILQLRRRAYINVESHTAEDSWNKTLRRQLWQLFRPRLDAVHESASSYRLT